VRNRQLLTGFDQKSGRGGPSIGESWPIPPAADWFGAHGTRARHTETKAEVTGESGRSARW